MKRTLFFTVFSLFSIISAFGQSDGGYLPNFNPPSPESSALGKYVEHPVGYYTGTPQINIPLFEIKCGRITLPISLSYHGSGVKVDEVASRVGNGWVLNAGGVVTRTLKGQWCDEGKFGYFAYLAAGAPGGAGAFDYDTEPDQHFYNFNGKLGQIFFTDVKNYFSPESGTGKMKTEVPPEKQLFKIVPNAPPATPVKKD